MLDKQRDMQMFAAGLGILVEVNEVLLISFLGCKKNLDCILKLTTLENRLLAGLSPMFLKWTRILLNRIYNISLTSRSGTFYN